MHWHGESERPLSVPSTPPLGEAGASWIQALGWVAGGGDTQEGQNGDCAQVMVKAGEGAVTGACRWRSEEKTPG